MEINYIAIALASVFVIVGLVFWVWLYKIKKNILVFLSLLVDSAGLISTKPLN